MKSISHLIRSIALAAASLTIGLSANTAFADTSWSNSSDHTSGVGGGGFNFNNGASLIGTWDNFADFGDLIFTAHFNNVTFDNTGIQDASSIGSWGPGSTATYGQSFVAAQGTTSLNDFTFFINDNGSEANFSYQAFVMTWSGGLSGVASSDQSSSTLLYVSNPLDYVGNGALQAITATIEGGLSLTEGNSHLIGFTTLGANVVPPTAANNVPDEASSALLLVLGFGLAVSVRRRLLA